MTTDDLVARVLNHADAMIPAFIDSEIPAALRKALGRRRAKELRGLPRDARGDAHLTCVAAMCLLETHWPEVARTLKTEPSDTGPAVVWCILSSRHVDLLDEFATIYDTCAGMYRSITGISESESGVRDSLAFFEATWSIRTMHVIVPILPAVLLGFAKLRKYGEIAIHASELARAPESWSPSQLRAAVPVSTSADDRQLHGPLKVQHLIGAAYGLVGAERDAVDRTVLFAIEFTRELCRRAGLDPDGDESTQPWRPAVALYGQAAAIPPAAGHFGLTSRTTDVVTAGIGERISSINRDPEAIIRAINDGDANSLLTTCAVEIRRHLAAQGVELSDEIAVGMPMLLAACATFFNHPTSIPADT